MKHTMARKKTKREEEESNVINSKIDALIEQFKDLFNEYDFYVSDKVPEGSKAIEIGKDLYIVFTKERIKEKLNTMMEEMLDEAKEKGENPFAKINVE